MSFLPLMVDSAFIDSEGRMINWAKDPFDESFKKGTLKKYSELKLYDKDFPDHPLTIVRTMLNQIREYNKN